MTTLNEDLTTRWTPSAEQDAAAYEGLAIIDAGHRTYAYTAHVLVGKEFGWWTTDVEVVPVGTCFLTREAACVIAQAEAKRLHAATGKPCVGGYTVHSLPAPGEEPPTSADGTVWQTRWAVFEDILARYPKD